MELRRPMVAVAVAAGIASAPAINNIYDAQPAFAGATEVDPVVNTTPEEITDYDRQMQQYCGNVALTGNIPSSDVNNHGNQVSVKAEAKDKKFTFTVRTEATNASELDADCAPALYNATLLTAKSKVVENGTGRILSSGVKVTRDGTGREEPKLTVSGLKCKSGQKSRKFRTSTEYAAKLGNGNIVTSTKMGTLITKKCAK